MGNPAGVRRDFEALERRRLEAARLLRQGLNQFAVARRLNVCHRSVGRWAKAYAEQGRHSLRQAGRGFRGASQVEGLYLPWNVEMLRTRREVFLHGLALLDFLFFPLFSGTETRRRLTFAAPKP